MSVKRHTHLDRITANRFILIREGANHSIYSNGDKTIPVKRHTHLDRITANKLCKQAGLAPIF